MKKNLLLLIGLTTLYSCDKRDDCFTIGEKFIAEGQYYFLDDELGNNRYENTRPSGQIIISEEVYNEYSVGDEFCTN
jgi:hypothetical protein